MSTTLRTSFAATLGALALSACDAGSPPDAAAPQAVDRPSSAPGSLTEVLRDKDAYSRARALGALLPTLGPEAVPEVRAALGNESLEVGGAEYELLVRFWASHEPEAATRWAADRSPNFYRNAVVMIALPYWVAKDHQATMAAVEKWQAWRPDVREAASRALVLGWYEAGLPGLTDYIRDMGAGFEQQLSLSTYLRAALSKEGSEAVMRWAESVPEDDPAYKLTVYRQVASALPLFDHGGAMRWCEAHCDGPHGNNMRNIIAGRWVVEDGPGALAWLETAPDGHEKNLAIRMSFATWAGWEPDAALAWMAEQTDGRELPAWLAPALPVYAVVLAEKEPTAAIDWAQKIEKDLDREMTLIKVARRWREKDQGAAEAWLEQSPLSAESREQVRDPNWRRGGAPKRPPSS